MKRSVLRVARTLAIVHLAGSAQAQVTQRVSLSSSGVGATNWNFAGPITPDGRYVLFSSGAPDLVPGDTNGWFDAFVRDRRNGATELVSMNSVGVQGDGQSRGISISADGRFIAMASLAGNLALEDTNAFSDVFVRDRHARTTELISLDSDEVPANNWSSGGLLTPDGRFVVFVSVATNLDPPSSPLQVYVRDRLNGTTELASLGQAGARPNNESWAGTISDDGRYVAFVSLASNLVPGDTNYNYDVFVRDRWNGTTERASVSTTGGESEGSIDDHDAWISGNGRFVAFMEGATNLVPGDTNGFPDIFVRDLRNAVTERVNVSAIGLQANNYSGRPQISFDGRYVAFMSSATNLSPQDPNALADAYVYDRETDSIEVASVNSSGQLQNNALGTGDLRLSRDARFVVFDSIATNLVPGPVQGFWHVYVRDRIGGTSFTSLCDPGVDEVVHCPCSNPPGGPGRGCNNSAATGGAALTASGGTFLTSDSLVLLGTRMRPDAINVTFQGRSSIPSGVPFGQGVRCVGGSYERLYTKHSFDGSVSVPDFAHGDPQISVRSAARGDPIQAGESRWYLVYYRDPVVLGGCDAWKTFNATQTGRVTWLP